MYTEGVEAYAEGVEVYTEEVEAKRNNIILE